MYTNMTTNLMVENVEKSVAFYQDILGFVVAVSVPNQEGGLQFAILAKDNLTIMVQEKNNLMEEYPVLKAEKLQPSITLYITVNDLDDLYSELKKSYAINTEIHTSFYGTREFAITDVDGYVLTFAEDKEA
jgi:Uncharacterized protein conserved in bacteria